LDSPLAALLCAPVYKSKTSKFSSKVSCKRRVQRRASCINILVGILPFMQNMSMEISNSHSYFRQTNLSRYWHVRQHMLHHFLWNVHVGSIDGTNCLIAEGLFLKHYPVFRYKLCRILHWMSVFKLRRLYSILPFLFKQNDSGVILTPTNDY
jgi:hypothetical protein